MLNGAIFLDGFYGALLGARRGVAVEADSTAAGRSTESGYAIDVHRQLGRRIISGAGNFPRA